MCGILGIFETNETTATAFIKEGLKIQQNRGIDAVGVSDGSQIKTAKSHSELTIPKATELIAHNLHAIINHIPQPLEKNKTHISHILLTRIF